MGLLHERLLLEEDGFEDIESTEEETTDKESSEGESSDDFMSVDDLPTDDDADAIVDDGTEIAETPATTLYKVEFTLGSHSNWSRIDATSEEEAKQTVQDYITQKWPDRKYEFVSIEEFDENEELEEELNESLSENIKGMGEYSDKFYAYLDYLKDSYDDESIQYLASQLIRYCKEEDLKDLWIDRMGQVAKQTGFCDDGVCESLTDAQPIETGANVGMASVISDLIKDEYEAIDGYNSAIATAEAEGFEEMINVLTEIQAEENLHIGQLQAVMKTLDPNAHLISDGEQEGLEQLANPLGDGPITESLDNMSTTEQEMFVKCVNEYWHMSVMEWIQKYQNGELQLFTVNSYEDIPGEDLILISSTDMSQGTGNVIMYVYMNPEDGALYRYAEF